MRQDPPPPRGTVCPGTRASTSHSQFRSHLVSPVSQLAPAGNATQHGQLPRSSSTGREKPAPQCWRPPPPHRYRRLLRPRSSSRRGIRCSTLSAPRVCRRPPLLVPYFTSHPGDLSYPYGGRSSGGGVRCPPLPEVLGCPRDARHARHARHVRHVWCLPPAFQEQLHSLGLSNVFFDT